MDKIVEIAKALADKHTIAGWELLDPDKQRAFEQEAGGYVRYFQEVIEAQEGTLADWGKIIEIRDEEIGKLQAERDTLKATIGRQEDRFWAQVTDDNTIIHELESEVKAGAGMLADMHDKYESASQAKEHERERILGIIANAAYSKPGSLDMVLPFKTWQELCRVDVIGDKP